MSNNMQDIPGFAALMQKVAEHGDLGAIGIAALPLNAPEKIALLLSLLSAPMSAIAALSRTKDEPITQDQMLFAALLVQAALQPNAQGVAVDFGPHKLLEAAEAFEKLTGNKAEGRINSGMLEAARGLQKQGEDVVIDLMTRLSQKRSPNEGDTKH